MTDSEKKMSQGFEEHATETRPIGTITVKAKNLLPKDVIVWAPDEKTLVEDVKQVFMITHYSEETKQSYTVLRELEDELDVER